MAEAPSKSGDSAPESNPNPPIMRVDAPTDDVPEELDDNEKNATQEEIKICGPSNSMDQSKVNVNPFTNSQNKRGILKPPQLSLKNSNNTAKSFVLNPSRLNPQNASSDNGKDSKSSAHSNGETPKFVPLIQSDTISTSQAPTTSTASTTTPSFVFGQNLQERVIAGEGKAEEPKPSTSVTTNGTTEMLFSSVMKSDGKEASSANKETKTLSESAREYEESRASKRKYEEVEVITGEEGEKNILNTTCKLFAFDKASGSWQERGRGVLRLNDLDGEEHTHSRLVFRTTGSLRVVLNTKVWAEMTVEQASEKSVRFTALDGNGVIKVFLAMASFEDSRHLYSQLHVRVQNEIALQKHKKPHMNADSGGN